jgi:membrane protein DedA with SNARE-associated domain
MKLAAESGPADEAAGGPPVRVLIVVAAVAASIYALVLAGVVELPDFPKLLQDLSDRLGAWTYALVGALAFLETGAFIGLVAPGETALALGGVVAASGEISLWLMIPIAWICAFAGDVTSFALGRHLGTPWLDRHGARFGITPARREQVQRFLDRYGPRAIVIGRFIGIVRAVAPFLYGSSGMRLRTFVPWSLLGTGVWATAFTLAGYVFSESFEKAADTLAHGALALAVIVTVGLLIRAYVQHRRAKTVA